MNNFELQEQAEFLVDTHTPLQLAKLLIEVTELLDDFDRFSDTDVSYLQSPFGHRVRDWLSVNLKTITPKADFAEFISWGSANVSGNDK